ncbi:sulfate transport system permease protein CysW [Sporolactobacillus inulinus]|uniref:Sulfate transport system permease protein CysW n=1 Tax=Sporolactobacillus inulinus TaxID=2078 RepID=A0A4Y1ZD34_9BACL|nr:sulfate transport system permease protein CysW [Sporolactobacillus inulinus]
MESTVQPNLPGQAFAARHSLRENVVRWSLITVVLLFFFGFLIIPLVSIFLKHSSKGSVSICRRLLKRMLYLQSG